MVVKFKSEKGKNVGMRKGCFLEKEERKNLIETKENQMAGKQGNNLAGRKSNRGRRPEKEWQKIGIAKAAYPTVKPLCLSRHFYWRTSKSHWRQATKIQNCCAMCGRNQTSMKDACKSTSRCFIALFVQAFDMQRPDTRDLPIVGSAIVDHYEGAIVAREGLRLTSSAARTA